MNIRTFDQMMRTLQCCGVMYLDGAVLPHVDAVIAPLSILQIKVPEPQVLPDNLSNRRVLLEEESVCVKRKAITPQEGKQDRKTEAAIGITRLCRGVFDGATL
jgi:hypothetical protein